ncbi:MAG: hypothetical protein ACKOCM_08180 [Cyanobacteriota bacterium]
MGDADGVVWADSVQAGLIPVRGSSTERKLAAGLDCVDDAGGLGVPGHEKSAPKKRRPDRILNGF